MFKSRILPSLAFGRKNFGANFCKHIPNLKVVIRGYGDWGYIDLPYARNGQTEDETDWEEDLDFDSDYESDMDCEAPVFRSDGRFGSIFDIGGDNYRVRLPDRQKQADEDLSNFSKIESNINIWKDIARSVFTHNAMYSMLENSESIRGTSFQIVPNSFLTDYHCVPHMIKRGYLYYCFDKIRWITNYAVPNDHHLIIDKFAQCIYLNNDNGNEISREYIRNVPFGENSKLFDSKKNVLRDPISKIEWKPRGHESSFIDIAAIKINDLTNGIVDSSVIIPACIDDKEIDGSALAFVGYFNGNYDARIQKQFEQCLSMNEEEFKDQSREEQEKVQKSIEKIALDAVIDFGLNHNKVISCGKCIAISDYTGAATCSSWVGASGSPYFLLENPNCGTIGTHLGNEYSNRGLFMSVNHPQYVAKWSLMFFDYVLPILAANNTSTNNNNEKEYCQKLVDKAMPYVEKHKTIIEFCNNNVSVNDLMKSSYM